MSIIVLTEVREVDDTGSGRYTMAKSFTIAIATLDSATGIS